MPFFLSSYLKCLRYCSGEKPVSFRKIFAWMKKVSRKFHALVDKLESRAEEKSEVVLKYAFWGLVILVAIPLPGTGAWTGALVAAMLNMRLKKALPAIVLGVLGAAVIVPQLTGIGGLPAISFPFMG